ncbi:transposase [Novosphingobium sp. YAF33]|uniref:transposase n=1 Tax=Novosphingobium sp. YAF33 TaxID=3233082 RepID=UPI003F947694
MLQRKSRHRYARLQARLDQPCLPRTTIIAPAVTRHPYNHEPIRAYRCHLHVSTSSLVDTSFTPPHSTDQVRGISRLPFLPLVTNRGRKPATDLRDVLDALRYLARTGWGWRMLQNDFPLWQTVHWCFRALRAPALLPYDPRRHFDA